VQPSEARYGKRQASKGRIVQELNFHQQKRRMKRGIDRKKISEEKGEVRILGQKPCGRPIKGIENAMYSDNPGSSLVLPHLYL
jgi:hypothetical protein